MTIRKIVQIDEEKCNGCGACATKCAEGAIQIIDGKARLISDQYCDGLGACLGECPEGAIIITEREADQFDEAAVHEHLHGPAKKPLPCGCPGSSVASFERHPAVCSYAGDEHAERVSELTHWPVQLTLVPPGAPFLKEADVVLAADCVPFAYPAFHEEFLRDHALLVACPKLDDFQAHLAKLTQIVRQARPRSLTVVHMEVPCCSGLMHMARQAVAAAGASIPLNEVVISVGGQVLQESACE